MAGQASARKLALVIGNSQYVTARPLPNAVKDATAVAVRAAGLGFRIFGGEAADQPGLDLNHQETMARFEAFAREITAGSTVLFFYAGHGLQVADENYVVPVDANLGEKEPLAEMVPIRRLIEWAASKAGPSGKVIVLLDACRENPFSPAEMRALTAAAQASDKGFVAMTGGFATMKMQAKPDCAPVFVSYATAPGEFAYDGKDKEANSPFTTAVLAHMGTRGLTLNDFADRVGLDVQTWAAAHGLMQDPWSETNLKREFSFSPARSSPVYELGILGFVAGVFTTLGLFDVNKIRVPFDGGKLVAGNLWVLALGLLFGAVVAFGVMRWGSRRTDHAIMACLGTWVSYALALIIISSSQFGRLPEKLDFERRSIMMAVQDPSFIAYAVLAVVAALLCWIGARLMSQPPADADTFVAQVARVTERLIPVFVLIGLIALDLFISIGSAQIVATAMIWLFAGIVIAAGSALSLKPQGSVFLGFGAATGAIVVGLMAALFFAIITVVAKTPGQEAFLIVLLGGLWYAVLGAQLGYCFSFYVPEYGMHRGRRD